MPSSQQQLALPPDKQSGLWASSTARLLSPTTRPVATHVVQAKGVENRRLFQFFGTLQSELHSVLYATPLMKVQSLVGPQYCLWSQRRLSRFLFAAAALDVRMDKNSSSQQSNSGGLSRVHVIFFFSLAPRICRIRAARPIQRWRWPTTFATHISRKTTPRSDE